MKNKTNMSDELNIIIFGSSGLMGTAFEKICKKQNLQCTGLSHEDIEITSKESISLVFEKHNPNVIINCVAIPSIEPCEENPKAALDLHCNSVFYMAKECAKRDIVMVQPSTHAVFDGLKEEPYTEDDEVKATSTYSATKYLTERIAMRYCTRHYIPRLPTMFGPRRNKSMGFVDKVVNWINDGKELKIADDKMDSPTYSYDAAKEIISLVTNDAPYGIYHIANEGWVSYYDFVVTIRDLLGADNIIFKAKDKDFSSRYYKPLRTALRSVKLSPLRNYREALKDYLRSLK